MTNRAKNAIRNLERMLVHIREAGHATTAECIRLLTLCREIAEAQEELGELPHLRLYADWTLHTQLDRAGAKAILDALGEVFVEYGAGDPGELVERVNEILSPEELREQLEHILRANGLPSFLVDDRDIWLGVVRKILTDLLDKPLVGSGFTEEEVRTGWGQVPRVVRLVADGEGDQRPILWEVQTGPRVYVRGRFLDLSGNE